MSKLTKDDPTLLTSTKELAIQSCEAIDGCGIEATISSTVEPEACHKIICGNL